MQQVNSEWTGILLTVIIFWMYTEGSIQMCCLDDEFLDPTCG